MTNICIGLLAYNEEGGIGCAINSIYQQDLLTASDVGGSSIVDVVVVPNGCIDRTAEVASKAIDAGIARIGATGRVTGRVVALSEPGKENAWNHFVHEIADPESDYLILMDADVRLEHPGVLSSLVRALEQNPEAVIAGGHTVKHLELKDKKSLLDRVSISAGQLRRGDAGVFAGCLYCGRGDALRAFRLPTVLMGEDAFVRAMIVTRGFTTRDGTGLVIRASDARVVFEAYTGFAEVLRNKTRRMLELTINAIIYTKLWSEATPSEPAGVLTKRWFAENPRWSEELVESEFARRGWFKIPRHFVTSQFHQIRRHPWRKRLVLLPVAAASVPLNALAVWRANRLIHKGQLRGLWDKPGQSAESASGSTDPAV